MTTARALVTPARHDDVAAPRRDRGSGEDDLGALLQAYSRVTDRLKRSHDLLAREVRRLHEQLEAKNRELAWRERLAALGEMAAGVAHEIRNPLGGIALYASLLERDLRDSPEPLKIARCIGDGVGRLERVITDILAFAGEAEPNRRPAALADILDGALAQTQPQLEQQSITVETDERLRDVVLYGDAAQLGRVFVNLIVNAADAVGEASHGAGGRIWIRPGDAAPEAGYASIVVEDTGPGIPDDMLHRVFNPFFTTRDAGTGLGLAIVHRAVESHDGRITAGNRAEGGARFVLSLPTAEAAGAG